MSTTTFPVNDSFGYSLFVKVRDAINVVRVLQQIRTTRTSSLDSVGMASVGTTIGSCVHRSVLFNLVQRLRWIMREKCSKRCLQYLYGKAAAIFRADFMKVARNISDPSTGWQLNLIRSKFLNSIKEVAKKLISGSITVWRLNKKPSSCRSVAISELCLTLRGTYCKLENLEPLSRSRWMQVLYHFSSYQNASQTRNHTWAKSLWVASSSQYIHR